MNGSTPGRVREIQSNPSTARVRARKAASRIGPPCSSSSEVADRGGRDASIKTHCRQQGDSPISFSFSEFEENDFGFAKIREACNFLDLPRVRQAVKEKLVRAHRENKAIVAAFPAKVRKAMKRLSEIRPHMQNWLLLESQANHLPGNWRN